MDVLLAMVSEVKQVLLTKNILLQAGIIEITDLTNLSKAELMDIQSFGKKSYEEVCQQLESMELLPSDWD